MNAQLDYPVTLGMCCCSWSADFETRLRTDPTCSLHGVQAVAEAPRKALERKRAAAQMSIASARMEAVTWIRRHRAAKRRLCEISKQLEAL